MKGRFFKNVTYMSSGNFFKFFIAFVSTAIYVRVIGTSGYVIIGIVFSFLNIVSRFDIPFFLSLVKYNSDYYRNKKHLFESMFSTLYNSILLSNIPFFIVLSLLAIFLSTKVYSNQNLIPFYFIAIFIFMIDRVNSFLKQFLRANKREVTIQKAIIPSLTTEFLLTIIFMLVFELGVLSVFMGIFIGKVLEYFLLNHYTKTFTKYRPYFSLSLLVKVFKEYAFQNYISKSLGGLILYGGLFVSTIYLNSTSLGILTIFISIAFKLREFSFAPLFYHLSPIYSYEILKKNYSKIKKMIKNITSLFIILFIILTIFLITIGKPLYLLYFGSQLEGTYFAFLLIISGSLLLKSFIAHQTYIFVSNIKLYNKILIFVGLFFFILLFPMLNNFGLIGVATTYFITYTIFSIAFLYYSNKMLKTRLNKENLRFLIIGLIFLIISIMIHSKDMAFMPVFAVLLFIILILLILAINFKKLIKIFKYVISEI